MKNSPFRHLSSVFWKRDLIQLTLFLTNRCNAKCPFCFYLSRKRPNDLEELSLSELEKISSSTGNLLWLAFSGGEIFLRDDLVEISRMFYRNNNPAIILLPTNGMTPNRIYRKTEAILKSCPDSVITVKLSLDGSEKLHDSLRGVEGAYSKVMFSYEALVRLLDKYDNFELGVNTVFCAANQDKMTEIIQFVRTMDKIKTHTISLIRGEIQADEMKEVSMEKYQTAISRLESNLKISRGRGYSFTGARLKAAQDILQRRLIYDTYVKQQQIIPCQAGKLTAVITETGDVFPCESFRNKLGNVRDSGYDLKKILARAAGRKARENIKRNKCYCTHECYMMMNILFNLGQYPALLKEYAKLNIGFFHRPPSTRPSLENTL
jgi:radical SAM protein with 4Fe4S-binding SPASM domain